MMKKITKVKMLEGQPECISVELANGSIVLLELAPKLSDPLFAEIRELSQVKTDGERVYWINGASLTLDEIMKMLESEEGSENKMSMRKNNGKKKGERGL